MTKNYIDTRNSYPFAIHYNYDNFRMTQYHLIIDGLYKRDEKYFIVCLDKNDDTLAIDGTKLSDWYLRNKIVGCNTELTPTVEKDFVKINELTKSEKANLVGLPRNMTWLYNDLLSMLSANFPDFKLSYGVNGEVILSSQKEITDTEFGELEEVIDKMQLPILLKFQISDELGKLTMPIFDAPLLLRHSKSFTSMKDKSFKSLWENDEDFWNSNKTRLLDANANRDSFINEGFTRSKSSCVVSDNFKPENLRTFLTLYDTVYLRLPIFQHHANYFTGLQASLDELKSIAEMGRVKFILDQPLERYHPYMLNSIGELPTSSYIQSRRLACLTAIDLRHRIPILFPSFDNTSKYDLLHNLYITLSKFGNKNVFINLLNELGQIWGNYLENIHRFGCYGLQQFSANHIINFLFKLAGKDYGVEIMESEMGVNYAAALGAHIMPRNSLYNDEKLVTFIANLYSGVPKNFVPQKIYLANTTINNILVINDKVPLIEFAKTFENNDIDRFRSLIYGLTKHKKDSEELNSAIKLFNDYVKQYDGSKGLREKVGIEGFLVDLGLETANSSIPLGKWFLERFIQITEMIGMKHEMTREVIDNIKAGITGGTIPEAVLVARMRKQLISKLVEVEIKKKEAQLSTPTEKIIYK